MVAVDGARHPIGIVTDGDVVRVLLSGEVPGGQHLRWLLASKEAVLAVRAGGRAGAQPAASEGVLAGLVSRHDVVTVIVRQHDEAERALNSSGG